MTRGGFWAFRRAHPKWFEISVSVLTGLFIEIALIVFQPPALYAVRKFADDSADKMIRLAERTTDRIGRSPAFAFIDIDDPSWRDWNFPLITPRDKLARLIETAARSHPLEVVVDVDLAFADGADAQNALKALFARYDESWPPLLLVRALRPSATASSIFPAPRETFYDDETARHPNIHWGSPLFERSADNSVRRWKLFAPACGDSGQPLTIPSIHLLAANIARSSLLASNGASAPAARRAPWIDLYEKLAAFTPPNCQEPRPALEADLDATPSLPKVRVDGNDVSSRVIYRVAWKAGSAGLGPRVFAPEGTDTPLVVIRPARLVLGAAAADGAPGLQGRIVLIGGSFADSGDWHDTPIGRMPGALLLINAIEALSVNGTPVEPGGIERAMTSFGIVVLTAVAVAWLRASVAALVVAGGLLVLMAISITRFKSGVMLDLAIPAVGVGLHDLIEAAISFVRQVDKLGWRWILKPKAERAAEPAPMPREQTSSLEGSKS